MLNVKYEVNDYPAFKKHYWQGYSLNAGVGMDHRLNSKLALTACLVYSFENTVAEDSCIFSQDEKGIALPHTFLQMSIGVKIDLSQLNIRANRVLSGKLYTHEKNSRWQL